MMHIDVIARLNENERLYLALVYKSVVREQYDPSLKWSAYHLINQPTAQKNKNHYIFESKTPPKRTEPRSANRTLPPFLGMHHLVSSMIFFRPSIHL